MDWGNILGDAVRAGVGVDAVVYALAAIGLNIHFGYAGLLNFGQAAFLAVAGYGLAVSVATVGLPFWIGILVGLAGAVVLAVLLGIPTLRLRADYLAITTIAAAEIFRLVVRSTVLVDETGGSDGLTQFTGDFFALNPLGTGSYGIGPVSFNQNVTFVLIVGWILVAVCCVIVWLLMRSPWGRVLKGVREDEDAVRSLGKNVYAYKLQALVIGGVMGSLGGFIYALGRAAVQPDTYASELTFFVYTALLIGGAARVLGPVVGAVIFWVVLSLADGLLRGAITSGTIPDGLIDTAQVGPVRFMLVGLALMLLMIFRPQGLFGDRRELALDAR